MAAGLANVVRTLHLTAIRAFDIAGRRQMVVRPAHIAAGFAGFLFRHSHDGNPLRLQARTGRAEGELLAKNAAEGNPIAGFRPVLAYATWLTPRKAIRAGCRRKDRLLLPARRRARGETDRARAKAAG